MKVSEIFLMLFYGLSLLVVVYLVYGLVVRQSIPNTTVIYQQPDPVVTTEIVYPWYGGYNWWPMWNGGYWGNWGYRTRPNWVGRGRYHRGGVRDGVRSGGMRMGGGGGRIGGGGRGGGGGRR